MKRFELIMVILFGVALIFKLCLFPGGSILCTSSLMSLACFYNFFSFAFFNNIKLGNIFSGSSYKGISALRIIVAICAGCGLSALCFGILFRIQHYPGGMIMLSVGLITVLITAIIVLVDYLRSKSDFYRTVLLRVAVIGGLGLLLFFTSDLTVVKIQYRNHPDYIKAYERYLEAPQSEEAIKQLEIEYRKAANMPQEEEFEEYYRQKQ